MNYKGEIVWVEPRIEWCSPTMKNMLMALPYLLDMGWQIEFLCLTSDEVDPRVRIRRVPSAGWLGPIEPWWFRLAICIDALIGPKAGPRYRRMIHDFGAHHPLYDLRSVQFESRAWLTIMWNLKSKTWKDYVRMLLCAANAAWEALFYRLNHGVLLPVSPSIAGILRQRTPRRTEILVVPNVLDKARFHPGVRDVWRAKERAELKLKDNDVAFLFASLGHFLRKGLWQAVAALEECRSTPGSPPISGDIRFLVVGVSETAAPGIIRRLDAGHPHWRDWVTLIPPTETIERFYAAADAFIFPSRFEAGALVPMEASACGLPLLVTPFGGTEIYFKDGMNGKLLSWDVHEMAATIREFLREGWHKRQCAPTASTSPLEHAKAHDQIYSQLLSRDRTE